MNRSLRSRLDAAEAHRDSAPARYRFIHVALAPDGRTLPAQGEIDRLCAEAEAEGFRPLVMQTVHTAHSLRQGHGPAEWQPYTGPDWTDEAAAAFPWNPRGGAHA